MAVWFRLPCHTEPVSKRGFALKVAPIVPERRKLSALAAGTGRLGCLRVLSAWGSPLDRATWDAAATRGHLPVLRYLHKEKPKERGLSTMACAVECGDLDCLKFLHSIGPEWYTMEIAAAEGQLEVFDYLIEQGCPISAPVCVAAAETSQYECLRHLRFHGCPWDAHTTTAIFTRSLYCHRLVLLTCFSSDSTAFTDASLIRI
jgi:hypothetical protein